MQSLRFNALDSLASSPAEVNVAGVSKITGIFNENVFTLKVARQFLSDEAYKSLAGSIKSGKKIDRSMGGQIAAGRGLQAGAGLLRPFAVGQYRQAVLRSGSHW